MGRPKKVFADSPVPFTHQVESPFERFWSTVDARSNASSGGRATIFSSLPYEQNDLLDSENFWVSDPVSVTADEPGAGGQYGHWFLLASPTSAG